MRKHARRTAIITALVPTALALALAPSAQAGRKMTCEPGIQWTSAYQRTSTRQTVTFENRTKEDRSDAITGRQAFPLRMTASKLIALKSDEAIAAVLKSMKDQYGIQAFEQLELELKRIPVVVPAKRRLIVRRQIGFVRFRGQFLVPPNDPLLSPGSKPVPGLPPGCDLRTVGPIVAVAPNSLPDPQRVVRRLKKKS